MNPFFFKVLLNRYHPGAGESFLKALPKEESQQIIEQNASYSDPLPLLTMKYDQIKATHYSWLSEAVQQIQEPLRPLVVASLPEAQSLSLSKKLKLPQIALAEPFKNFFLEILWQNWKQEFVLPLSYLPQSSLLPLIAMEKRELVEFIDFLGLYDLVETIRHIVDRKLLQTIYRTLTPKKLEFIRLALHQKEKVVSPRIQLQKWSGDVHKFHDLIHRHGLLRLGKGISKQSSAFLWHAAHRLDIGRGNILAKYYHTETKPGIVAALESQMIFLINFLKRKKERAKANA